MTLLTNPFKRGIAEGQLQIGFWQALANAYTAELCATAGFDWLLFDCEHAPNDVPLLLTQLQAVAPYRTHPVARIPNQDPSLIKRYLDVGVQTLLVPYVESAAQAEALVQATRYPPAGIRGVAGGLVRASRWGAIPDYLARADDEICLVVQVESLPGLEAAAEIAAVDGVDGVFIGPADLSAAMGYRGQPGHPDVSVAVTKLIETVRAAGKAAGTLTLDEALAQRWIDAGCSFVAVGTDVALLRGAALALAKRFGCEGSGQAGY